MTQSVTNTLNNLEQMISAQPNTHRVSESVSSAMDRAKDFTKVFESTLNKDSLTKKAVSNDKDLSSVQDVTTIKDTLTTKEVADNKEVSTINDLKADVTQEDLEANNNLVLSEDFKEVLKQVTDEANVETSLDLTLAKDINEIISQLKEAVENVTEMTEEQAENTEILVQNILETEESTDVAEDITVNIDGEDSTAQKEEGQQENLSFEQLLTFVDKSMQSQKEIKSEDGQIENEIKIENDSKQTVAEMVDFTSDELVEFSENVTDEVIVSKNTGEFTDGETSQLAIDEDVLKELKVESISADTETSNGETLMQNQAPEEYAVKAMINNEIEAFEVKLDSVQNSQNISSQAQVKATDVNPSRILDQISRHLDGLQNNSKVNIVLNPESLGKVNIHLLSTKEGLTAQFTVTTQEARDLLTKGLDGLKESLGALGVSVDNVSVKVADSQKSEYHQDWTEQEGSNGGNKDQRQPNKEEKEKELFEKMMAEKTDKEENGNV